MKVKLPQNLDVLEFDIFFAHLPKDAPSNGADVTVNWRSLEIANAGIFYTDANAYKMVKRDVYKAKEYVQDDAVKKVIVPTYYYPVNSAIFIESASKQ